MAHTTLIEFKTREGLMCLQRVDMISTVLESTVQAKGGPSKTVMFLLLANNNRIEVVDETRASIMAKFLAANGTFPVVIISAPQPEAEPEAEPEVEAA